MSVIAEQTTRPIGTRRGTATIAACVALGLTAALAIADVYFDVSFNGSPAFPSILLSCWWCRSRKYLLSLTLLLIGLTIGCGVVENSDIRAGVHRGLAVFAIIATAVICRYLLDTSDELARVAADLKTRGDELKRANSDLAAREHEIAEQNEELRSQTEELERQSEELHVANDELARRERTLEALLRLSRSLTSDMTRSDTLDRICQALGEMINGPGLGVGVKIREGENMRLVCHWGFGPAGPKLDVLGYEQSFGRLVLERNHTGYIEDLEMRPDLETPQPKEGEPFRSILAAPLRVNGRAVGTLEVYGRDRRTWSDEQIGMIESLASQTSISLQAAELFERVEQERERFETIFRTLPIGVSVLDASAKRVINNAAAVMMTGVPPENLIDSEEETPRFRAYQNGIELKHDELPLYRAARGEEVHGEEIDLAYPGGKRLTLLISAAPFGAPIGAGRFGAAVAAYTEISTIKSLQQELDARRRAAEEASVRKSRFLAQVSHDIRNPVNAINLLAELLCRTASEPAMTGEIPEIANDLRRNSLSLVDLVSDVLDLTRFDSGRIDLEESEFELGEMVRDECRIYQSVAAEKRIPIACHPLPRTLLVRTDRVKLSRVLGNLLSNALKFTTKGQIEVDVKAGQSNEPVRIIVSDTGPGIAPEFHERIFDEFFQLRSAASGGSNGGAMNDEHERSPAKGSFLHDFGRRGGGAGLGLAICKRLVDAMGGEIRVESELGKGSTFIVSLPASAVVRR